MRNIRQVLVILLLLSTLTGCLKYSTNMEVKRNKEVKLTVISAVDIEKMKELTKKYNSELEINDEEFDKEFDIMKNNEETLKKLEAIGFTYEEYLETNDKAKYRGIKITKIYKNIDEITVDEKTTIDMNSRFNIDINTDTFEDSVYFYRENNHYAASFMFDYKDGFELEGTTDEEVVFDFKYIITLPDKPIFSNATSTSKDGKTLTWDLKFGEQNLVEFEFDIKTTKLNFQIITSWLLMIAGLGVIVIIVVLTKKAAKWEDPTLDNNKSAEVKQDFEPIVKQSVDLATTNVIENVNEKSNECDYIVDDVMPKEESNNEISNTNDIDETKMEQTKIEMPISTDVNPPKEAIEVREAPQNNSFEKLIDEMIPISDNKSSTSKINDIKEKDQLSDNSYFHKLEKSSLALIIIKSSPNVPLTSIDYVKPEKLELYEINDELIMDSNFSNLKKNMIDDPTFENVRIYLNDIAAEFFKYSQNNANNLTSKYNIIMKLGNSQLEIDSSDENLIFCEKLINDIIEIINTSN